MKVGSHATGAREPGQAREGAAISGITRVPWGSPAGASRKGTPRFGKVEGGCTVRLSNTLIEVLIELLVVALASLSFFPVFGSATLLFKKVSVRMNRFIDMSMAISFIRDEINSRIAIPGFSVSSTQKLAFIGLSNGRVKEITYSVRKKGEGYRIYRKADGEGNNIIYESKSPIWFERKKRMVILHVEGYEFFIHEPRDFRNLSDFPGVLRYPLLFRGR